MLWSLHETVFLSEKKRGRINFVYIHMLDFALCPEVLLWSCVFLCELWLLRTLWLTVVVLNASSWWRNWMQKSAFSSTTQLEFRTKIELKWPLSELEKKCEAFWTCMCFWCFYGWLSVTHSARWHFLLRVCFQIIYWRKRCHHRCAEKRYTTANLEKYQCKNKPRKKVIHLSSPISPTSPTFLGRALVLPQYSTRGHWDGPIHYNSCWLFIMLCDLVRQHAVTQY